ncbi:MAG: S9 family peptidase, partial [Egibacteraceae bacterium]
GVATASGTPDALVVEQAGLEGPATAELRAAGRRTTLRSLAARPPLAAAPELARLGERRLASALLRPSWHDGREPLPVLLDPYGGPHAQRVLRSEGAFLASQWFAEAGFAVLVTDGRGSPGRGPAWEEAIAGDLASAPLADQVDALGAAAARWPFLDPDRVAIRGWSFGGFLAALAVLRRPDVFGAAIAGAPVTDWRLYDTHYTERYLGDPATDAGAYDRSSLLDDAAGLARPLLLIHGLSDDNVVVAHTLRLSRALTEAGRPHRVLPLSGVTHMTPQEVVAERLLTLQRDFLAEALALD